MKATALLLVVWLASFRLASASAGCCSTDTTVFMTATTTIVQPAITVYNGLINSGNKFTALWKPFSDDIAIAVTSVSILAQSAVNSTTLDIGSPPGAFKAPPTQTPAKAMAVVENPIQIYSMTTTTETKEITVTTPATITCTVGYACPYAETASNSTSDSVTSFELISSTFTQTVTVQLNITTGQYPAIVTPLTPITSHFSQSANASKIVIPNTSVDAAKAGILNSTSVISISFTKTSANSTMTSVSPALSSSSNSVVPTTSVIMSTPQPTLWPSTSTTVVTPVMIPVTSTVIQSGPASIVLPGTAGRNMQPPRIFGILAALAGYFSKGSALYPTDTVHSTEKYPPPCPTTDVCLTTTVTPTTTIHATPTDCAYHSDEQYCMPNLGFNDFAGRAVFKQVFARQDSSAAASSDNFWGTQSGGIVATGTPSTTDISTLRPFPGTEPTPATPGRAKATNNTSKINSKGKKALGLALGVAFGLL